MRRLSVALVALMTLSACTPATPMTASSAPTATPAAGGPASTASTAPASSAPASSAPSQKAVTITLANGKAEPNGERVDLTLGQHLVLTITSDRDDEVHVHGFDVEIAVKAGSTVTRDILMDRVGRFEVESHEPTLSLLVLQVR